MKSGVLLPLLGLLTLWAELPPASGQSRQVKKGECPPPAAGVTVSCDNYCSTDDDCPGNERCCSNGCGTECRLPTGENPGYCPKIDPDIVTICPVECSSDSQCGAGRKCCTLGCHVRCAEAVPAKPGTCPKRKVLQTFAPCENKCTDDRNCLQRQKCCFTGCGRGCLDPTGGDICQLPPEKGPCEALVVRYFYNPASGRCQQFEYGGCQGNRNNFRTPQECLQACGKAANKICNLPMDSGPCLAYSLFYFYNSVTQRCEQFVYGGCQGNENRFPTVDECLRTCGSSAKDICQLPPETGPCKAYKIRYFYNWVTQRCEKFVYGGCKGTENRFATEEECLRTCGEPGQARE